MRAIENLPGDNTARNYTFFEQAANIAYAATIALPVLKPVTEQIYFFATLTGAVTINAGASLGNLQKGDRVRLIIPCDGTSRTITWGTGIKSSAATLVLVINGKTLVDFVFDGTDLVTR